MSKCGFQCAYVDELGKCKAVKDKYCEVNYKCLYRQICTLCEQINCIKSKRDVQHA